MKKAISTVLALMLTASLTVGTGLYASAATVTKILQFDMNDYKNGTVTDSTGYGITLGKVGEGSLSVVPGKKGNAVQFDNAGLGINGLMLNFGKQYTICVTVKFPVSCGGGRVYGTGIYELGPGFMLGPTNDANWLYAGAANDEEQFIGFADAHYSQSAPDIFDNEWHTVAMVLDLDKHYTRLYVDGGLEAVNKWSNTKVKRSDDGTFIVCDANFTSEINNAFGLGCGGIAEDAFVNFCDCSIQDFTVYNKALTINEFRSLLGLASVNGGDSNDPEVTEQINVNITYTGNEKAPNNTEKNSLRDAFSGKNTVKAESTVTGQSPLTAVSFCTLGASVLIAAAAVLFYVKRKGGADDAVK